MNKPTANSIATGKEKNRSINLYETLISNKKIQLNQKCIKKEWEKRNATKYRN